MKILMTGATGMVGREVGKRLFREGHQLVVVSRSRSGALAQCPFPCEVIEGDLNEGKLPSERLKGVDGVVHLMGEPIAQGRWTEEKKERLRKSRIRATRNLRESFLEAPAFVISASAVGYYGDRGDEVLAEDVRPGDDFLAKLCVEWEREAQAFSSGDTRTVILRFGMILSDRGGALTEMLPPARAGVAGPLGSGRQWMSWIHIEDLVALISQSARDQGMNGVYNAVAPEAVRNKAFMKALTELLGRPHLLSAPAWGLRALFGEKAQVLLSSQRASADKVQKTGFVFRYPRLLEALHDLLGPLREGREVFMAEQYFDEPPERVFSFFAKAENLGRITPGFLDFNLLDSSHPTLQQGTRIRYRLALHGVPFSWTARIEEWWDGKKFVDVQEKGPFRLWHHTHRFEKMGAGTLMTDVVRYELPGGFPGWLAGAALVRKDVARIFEYRREKTARLI